MGKKPGERTTGRQRPIAAEMMGFEVMSFSVRWVGPQDNSGKAAYFEPD
jgi:hypothetical protein